MLRSPFHPGHYLRQLLVEHKISQAALARRIRVPLPDIEGICDECSPMTAAVAVRLAMALGTAPEFWLNLQSAYDLGRQKIARTIRPLVKVA